MIAPVGGSSPCVDVLAFFHLCPFEQVAESAHLLRELIAVALSQVQMMGTKGIGRHRMREKLRPARKTISRKETEHLCG